MTSEWHKSTSDVMPETIDTTSSKDYVLVRRNIEKIGTLYEYEEKFVDRVDWEVYQDILTVTPYTETKTAYIDDTETTFTTDKEGNLTTYVKDNDGNYINHTVTRQGSLITISFEPLEVLATVTISIQ